MALDWQTGQDTPGLKTKLNAMVNGANADATRSPEGGLSPRGYPIDAGTADAAVPGEGFSANPVLTTPYVKRQVANHPELDGTLGTVLKAPAPYVAGAAPDPGAPVPFSGALPTKAAPAAAPAPAAASAPAFEQSSVAGIFRTRAPDGSTVFTDTPGGHFEQSGSPGANPNRGNDIMPGALAPRGQVGTGVGNFSANDVTPNAPGPRYVMPTGDGVVDEGTRQGFQPGSPQWTAANANVQRAKGESDADFGARVAASKNAGLNFRSHSGAFTLPAQSTDPSVIGADAAYNRPGAPGGGGGGSGAAQPGFVGIPNLEQAKALSALQTEQQTRTLAARDQALKEQSIVDKQAQDRYETAKNDHLAANKDDITGAEKWANIAAARDAIVSGQDPERSAAGKRGLQALTDELGDYTNPSFGASGKQPHGTMNLDQYDYSANSVLNPFSNKFTVTRGLTEKGTPDPNGPSSSYRKPSPVLANLVGKNGENFDAIKPFVEYARRKKAAQQSQTGALPTR